MNYYLAALTLPEGKPIYRLVKAESLEKAFEIINKKYGKEYFIGIDEPLSEV